MASKEPQVVAETCGISTGEYRNILTNFGGIERALKADETATETLTTKFKSASWLDTNAKAVGPKELLTKTLDMVENSTKYYYTFKEMVQGTTGLQHILPNFNAVQESNPSHPKQGTAASQMVGSSSSNRLTDLEYEGDVTAYSRKVAIRPTSAGPIYIEPTSQTTSENVPTKPIFKIGEPHILEENVNDNKSADADTTEITPVQEESLDGDSSDNGEVEVTFPFDERNAKQFLSPSVLALLNKQRDRINGLIEEKRVLMHEVEELKKRLTQATENAKMSEEAVNIEIEECKKKMSEVEKEKQQMEQDHQEQIRNLKSNIAQLESDRESAKKDTKAEISDLKSQLAEAQVKLAQKDNQILRQENKILKLETEKTLKAKDEEHKKSLEEKDVQIRRLMEKLSLHAHNGQDTQCNLESATK